MADTDVQIVPAMQSEDAMTYLKGRGLELETIEAASLGYVEQGRYANSIAIPYFDAQGRCRLTRYRTLRPNPKVKYLSPKGGGRHLYNVRAVDEPVVAICEGEFDALVMGQIGIPAVAVPGANLWQREWRWLFRDCDLVYVVADADEAGASMRNKILAQVGMVTEAEPIDLPEGSDVTDLYLSDPEALKGLL